MIPVRIRITTCQGLTISSLLTDSSLVGFEFVYPASCWADSRGLHGELTDHTPPGVLPLPASNQTHHGGYSNASGT